MQSEYTVLKTGARAHTNTHICTHTKPHTQRNVFSWKFNYSVQWISCWLNLKNFWNYSLSLAGILILINFPYNQQSTTQPAYFSVAVNGAGLGGGGSISNPTRMNYLHWLLICHSVKVWFTKAGLLHWASSCMVPYLLIQLFCISVHSFLRAQDWISVFSF